MYRIEAQLIDCMRKVEPALKVCHVMITINISLFRPRVVHLVGSEGGGPSWVTTCSKLLIRVSDKWI